MGDQKKRKCIRFCLCIGYQKSRFGDCIAHSNIGNKQSTYVSQITQPNPTLDSYRKTTQKTTQILYETRAKSTP
jgi:hypothetical protein